MKDPFQPSLPAVSEPGRLSSASPLRPGWDCRHCRRPLKARKSMVVCSFCDYPTQRVGS